MDRTRKRRVWLAAAVATIAACSLLSAPTTTREVLVAQGVTVAPGVTVPVLLGISRLVEDPARPSAGGCHRRRSPPNAYGAFIAVAESPGSRAVRDESAGSIMLMNDLPTRAMAVAQVQPARLVGCVDAARTRSAVRVDLAGAAGAQWNVFKLNGGYAQRPVAREPGWACLGRDDGTARGTQAECACLFDQLGPLRRER